MAAPTPRDCWTQADREHPSDPAARRDRYIALLKHHGRVIDRPVGEGFGLGLPCGWGGRR